MAKGSATEETKADARGRGPCPDRRAAIRKGLEGKRIMSAGRGLPWLLLACLVAGCGAEAGEAGRSVKAGKSALEQSDVRGALGHFRRAVEMAPSSPRAHDERGQAAELLGEFEEAMGAYDAAARLEPSAVRFFRAGALADRMGNREGAVEWLKASLATGPSSRWEPTVEALLGGLFGSRVTREDVAERLFEVYIESGERTAALGLAREEGWLVEGADYCDEPLPRVSEEAEALLAMLVHPQEADCLLPLGMSLTKDGMVRLARLALVDRLQHSKDPLVREHAETFLRARLPGHDVAALAESLNIAGYNLQYVYKQPDEALRAYEKAIAADPAFTWPYSNTANVLADQGQREEAVVWYRKAITRNPNHWRAHLNLGMTLMELRRYGEALNPLRTAVALLPDDWTSHSNLGRTLLSLGREREGVREVLTSLRLNPDNRSNQELLDQRLGVDPRRGASPFSRW